MTYKKCPHSDKDIQVLFTLDNGLIVCQIEKFKLKEEENEI